MEAVQHDLFLCRILTINQVFLQENVMSLHLPGQDGDFEIFMGNSPSIQVLRPGIVTLRKLQENLFAFMSRGILLMDGKIATLYTSSALTLKDAKEETLAEALQHFSFQTVGNLGA
jgi:F0F1-type ATP synthase epsilon subunit